MQTDPIADMLTRIRNANKALQEEVRMPTSRIKESIARILVEEGYVSRVPGAVYMPRAIDCHACLAAWAPLFFPPPRASSRADALKRKASEARSSVLFGENRRESGAYRRRMKDVY